MPRTRHINPNAKYYPPRLLKKLDYIASYPFTLMEAPSGFGKTTLLEYFFETHMTKGIPRFTYDFESNEPLFDWRELCSRLEKIDPACAKALLTYGPPDEDNLGLIRSAIKKLVCSSETYLWLDNYKRWENPYAGEFLNMLSHHGGKELHVIVSSQPLSPANRKQADLSGGCWQMGDEDLIFRAEDISAYFSEAGIPLTDRQIHEVFLLTEGWIMALCLQMLCFLERGEFERGGITELMEHTFWDRLSEREKQFLLRISIFPRFTLGQASAVSGLKGAEIDHILRDKSYFIHFDSETRCFYPHSQLKTLLSEHFSCLSPAVQKQIYLDGAQLAVQEKDRLNTLRFFYAAGEWERILELPLDSYQIADIMTDDIREMVLEFMDRAPKESKLRHPRAYLSLAFCLFIMGEIRKLASICPDLEESIQNSTIDPEEKDALIGELELLRSFLEFNRISDMSRHHRKALELLGGPAKLISPKSLWTFGSPSILYLFWRESGKLDEELSEMDTCMPIYYELSHGHGSGAEFIMRAEAEFMRGNPDGALPLCYQGLFSSNRYHQDSIYQCGLFLLARIAHLKGNSGEEKDLLSSMEEFSARHREDPGRYTAELAKSHLALLDGKHEELPLWLKEGEIDDKRFLIMVQPLAHILYGRYLLIRKEYHKLLGIGEYFLGLSSIFPNLLPQVYIHLYTAAALFALGRDQEAGERFQMALDLAIPDRLYLPFAELSPFIRDLLTEANLKPEDRKAIAELSAFYKKEHTGTGVTFSPREREILSLLKEELTNKEIAKRMNLSPNTIRNTISGMLRKCGFKTRVQLEKLDETFEANS